VVRPDLRCSPCPRRQARAFLLGLLSDVDTRSCWQLAEQAGDRSPHRMQRLLGEAVWDADAVRDDVRQYVIDELGDPGAVLIADDTRRLEVILNSVELVENYQARRGNSLNNSANGVRPSSSERPFLWRLYAISSRTWAALCQVTPSTADEGVTHP